MDSTGGKLEVVQHAHWPHSWAVFLPTAIDRPGLRTDSGGDVLAFVRWPSPQPHSKQEIMSEIKAIIFDYGRVIGHFDHQRTAEKLAAYSTRSVAEIREFLYPDELEDQFEKGSVSPNDFVGELRNQLELNCSDETIYAAIADIFWPNDDVCMLIPRLVPRYRLILGSNTNAIHAEHFRKLSNEVLKHFHALVLSHEVEVRKPARDFFEHCVRLAEQPAKACLFIDDLKDNITGARAAGLQTLLYRGQPTLAAELAELGVVLSN